MFNNGLFNELHVPVIFLSHATTRIISPCTTDYCKKCYIQCMLYLDTIKANQVYLYVTKRIVSTVIIQWRIQDFSEVGRANPRGGGGSPTYDFAKFSQKLHEIERIGGGGGLRPLRSVTVILLFFNEFNRLYIYVCVPCFHYHNHDNFQCCTDNFVLINAMKISASTTSMLLVFYSRSVCIVWS